MTPYAQETVSSDSTVLFSEEIFWNGMKFITIDPIVKNVCGLVVH